MIRHATGEDFSRIAELLVFGKRVAYRTIFNNDVDSKNLQVLDVIEEYQNNPYLLENTLLYDDGIVKGIIGKRIDKSSNPGSKSRGQEKDILMGDKR